MKGKRNGKKAGRKAAVSDQRVPSDTESLWRLLSRLSWWVSSLLEADAKTKRLPGSLSMFYQDGGIKVCIRDRTQGRVAFVWAPGFEEALLKAQAALEGGTLDWRADRYAQQP